MFLPAPSRVAAPAFQSLEDAQKWAEWLYADHKRLEKDLLRIKQEIRGKAVTAHTHDPADITPQGSGSGLDADTVDGVEAASFLQAADLPDLVAAITIPSPGASEDATIFFTNVAITAAQVAVVVRGTTPSVTWNLYHNTDRSAAGNTLFSAGQTTTTESGSELTPDDDVTIPANSWVWIQTSAVSGTVDEISVAVRYTED